MRMKDGAFKSWGEVDTYAALLRFFHGRPYRILKDVALNQVVAVERGEIAPREFDYYTRASLDFLVCQADELGSFEVAIEYDGSGHDDPQQAWRDQVKNKILIEAGLPILRVGRDAILLRENTTVLEFILDQYFGEKAVSELRVQGKLGPEEEYFAQFPATLEVQKRLAKKGLYPPVVVMTLGDSPSTEHVYWYRWSSGLGDERPVRGEAYVGVWTGTARVEIFRGTTGTDRVFDVSKVVTIRDPNPQYNVPGVHGWHIAQELAGYLCFHYIESEWLPE